jgi:thiosulfate/3-mercaptopyruvate sulfurtransferase
VSRVLVPAGELLAADPRPRLLDVRWALGDDRGRERYLEAHLPGAVFVDLDEALAAHGSPEDGRHPLPSPERFAAELGRCGIGDGSVVLAYDDAGGVIAARLVWLLRAVGVDAALLDGGLLAHDGELETGWVEPTPATLTPRPWPAELLADLDTVVAAAHADGAVVLDARVPERYRGDVEPVDPRPGHIPGARNLSTRDHVDASGRFLPLEALRRRFAEAGVDEATDVVAYCGSGVTATHTLLALERAGLRRGRLYPGSWSAYAATDRPAATGPDPG